MSFPSCAIFRQIGILLVVLNVVLLGGTAVPTERDNRAYSGYKLFSVRQNDELQRSFLHHLQQSDHKLDFWMLDRVIGSEAHVLVPPEQIESFQTQLNAQRIAHREIISDYGRITEGYSFASMKSRKNPILTKYLRYQEIVDYLHSLALRYSSLVTVSSIGTSTEGRDIPVVTIRKPSYRATGAYRNGSQPVVFVDAGIHAREWAAPATALFLITELVENAAQHADLLDGLTWVIVPIVNPDGYEYSHQHDRLWRKTRRPSSRQCYGIDGNRNFDFHWAEVGASSMPCSITYHGEHSFSEPETRAIRDVLLRLKGRCKFYLTLHSYGQYLLYPWGWTSDLPSNWEDVDAVAQAGAEAIHEATGTKYTVGSSTNLLYPAAGGSDDWAYAVADVPIAITMELPGGGRSGYNPPPSLIEEIVKESFVGIETMALEIVKNYS